MDITLTQRGSPAVIPRPVYDQHWRAGLETLVSHKIVRIECRDDFVLVYPNQYVGSARCLGRRLRIEPRYPELLLQLRRNFPFNRRDVPLSGFDPIGERQHTSDLAVRFLAALSEAVHQGFPFRYEKRRFEGPSLAGSLNVGQTIRKFLSKNVYHQAVTDKSVKTVDRDFVDVVWCAAEALQDLDTLSMQEARMLDTMLIAAGPGTRDLPAADASSLTDSLSAEYTDRPEIFELIICCKEILDRNRSECDIESAIGDVSFSFTDADALWERAVHKAMQQAVSTRGWQARLHPWRGNRTLLFENGGPDLDPDVVVYDESSTAVIPVDAKDFAQRTAEAAGVYQVLAYARHLNAMHAVLIYLASGEDWIEEFGDEDIGVFAAGVRPADMDVLVRLVSVCNLIAARAGAAL